MRETKAAILAESRRHIALHIDESEKVCLNCQYYEPRWRESRGNVYQMVRVNAGKCLKTMNERKPLSQPCKEFLKEERRNRK